MGHQALSRQRRRLNSLEINEQMDRSFLRPHLSHLTIQVKNNRVDNRVIKDIMSARFSRCTVC